MSDSVNNLVTVLMYFFFDEVRASSEWPVFERALHETWRTCGPLKTVVVSNCQHKCIVEFAKRNDNVEIQVESRLVPGKLFSMSEDCNSRLYSRFASPYVLIVQNDGWPLRSGIEEFLGKWDFIGAPYVRNIWWKRLGAMVLDRHPMNGGFSLRTRRCCELVAKYWNDKYRSIGDCRSTSEDIFTTEFLPMHEPEFRKEMRFPGVREALRFSYENIGPYSGGGLPFGFHRLDSREIINRAGTSRPIS